jgi:RND family efflux transporter MFP subunit
MKKVLTIISVLAFIAFVAFKLTSNKKAIDANTESALEAEKYAHIPVKVITVNDSNAVLNLEESGVFKSRQEIEVSASVAGQVIVLRAKEGQFISKGAVIAQINNAALQSQLITAEAVLSNAIKDAKRLENALTVGATTKMQVEQAQLAIENAQTNISSIKEQMKFYTITAPMSGYVNHLHIEQGSYVMPGTKIIDIVDIGTLKLIVKVDETMVPIIKIGRSVPVTTDVFPGKKYIGTVTNIGVKSDNSQKFDVEITIGNGCSDLKSGMYGKAYFEKLSSTQGMFVPRGAIVGSLQDPGVYVINEDSTAHFKKITTGSYSGNFIAVTSGLSAGERVVTMGQINLQEGVKVKY